ncbi:MAG TPA: hypothetical protein VMH36_05510 [Alphaproteobacteria bacterium]|nr:hypothetical protein [Alphaproteobacteria bacterium]
MARYLIDGQGHVWDPFDDQLLVVLGDPDPDYDLVSYAVRNLGFVDVAVPAGPEDVTTIRLREVAVTAPALLATSELIARLPVGPVVIISSNEHWTEQRFDTPSSAVAWLLDRVNSDSVAVHFSDIAVVPQDLSRLSNRRLNALEQNDDRLALFFKKWRIASGRYSYDTTEFMVNFGLLDRAALARPSHSGAIVWDHLGHKLNMYERDDKTWHLTLVGCPVDQQNDSNYGTFVNKTFRETLESRQPRLDHVDAVIRNRTGAHRSRYDRLILPWETEDGSKIISTLSYKTDRDLDLGA